MIGDGMSAESVEEPVAYVISAVEGFADVAIVKRYAEIAGPSMEKFGGRFVVSNTVPTIVEGDSSLGHLSMVEFPSMKAAKAWYDSIENAEARILAPSAFSGRVLMIVEGIANQS
jgi:uncharacterized protein (DUF1330 family)